MTKPPARVAALVLAAGLSSRMAGEHKLLADLGGECLIRRTVRAVLQAGPCETVVVTGHRAADIEAALHGLDIRVVHNPAYAEGQAGSVAAGVAALRPGADAIMVALGDQALLTPHHYRALIGAYAHVTPPAILVPVHDGRRGNPIVFSAQLARGVASGEVVPLCRKLMQRHPSLVREIPVTADAYVTDCDTQDDLRRLRARLSCKAA
jgi:molybdenum cofactor cytidylyltransferase